jgi:hypothetical protein
MQQYYNKYLKMNSKSIKHKKSLMFTKIASEFRKVLQMDTPGSKIAPRLEKYISNLGIGVSK